MRDARAADLPGGPEPLVRVSQVTKLYKSAGATIRAVDSVSLEIAAGQCMGLVGETGSGKSTLGRLVLGLERPSSGRVQVQGLELSALSARRLRRLRATMAIVLQDPVASLNRRKSVGTIVETHLRIHRYGTRQARKRRVQDVLELVGLDPALTDRRPLALSGGQNQRVSIARALALSPRLVVLDEAVSALDVSLRAVILNLLHNLQSELGLTYLFISHDLAVVRYMCTEIAVMYHGRIVEFAGRDRLFASPRHPYTHALLDAIPRIDQGTQQAVLRIDEAQLGAMSQGCPALSYCPVGRDRATCALQVPPLVPVAAGHQVACHFPAELTVRFAAAGAATRPLGQDAPAADRAARSSAAPAPGGGA